MYEDFDIEEELKKLPDKPGVYLMHDEKDEIIYVGKAIVLRNRVRQYFRPSSNLSPKIQRMVQHVRRFEYIVTDSELEAFVLECNLIKLHRPHYNTMLMDDKTYPFIKVTVNEQFPKIMTTRAISKDKARYFGPFVSGKAVDDIIELLNKTYGIRTCGRNLDRTKVSERACLNYQIGQCSGPCIGKISQEEYLKNVECCIDFLEGKYAGIKAKIEQKMKEAAEELHFEEAASYRDTLKSIEYITQKQKITNSDMKDRDIVALAKDDTDCVITVFYVRDGRVMGRENFHMRIQGEEEQSEILSSFLQQFYMSAPYVPGTIMLSDECRGIQLLTNWLKEKCKKTVNIVIPKRGNKEKLVKLAFENAEMVLRKDKGKILREEERTIGAVKALSKLIGLSGVHRMEAYDISNTSGALSVGSMVVFVDGTPRKHDYRKFRIQTVVGPNDYASMREVLTRRLTHEGDPSFARKPDLILMDGGKGQVNVALEVLKELKLDIPVCGMVKDDRHRTRTLWYNDAEIPIDASSEEFKLITRIQDEAHRFAIDFHREIREKNQIHSVLDEINGIGISRRRALMQHFGDIERIKNADVAELMKAKGIPESAAKKVYAFFHKEEDENG